MSTVIKYVQIDCKICFTVILLLGTNNSSLFTKNSRMEKKCKASFNEKIQCKVKNMSCLLLVCKVFKIKEEEDMFK